MDAALASLIATAITSIAGPAIGFYAARRNMINKQRAEDAERAEKAALAEADRQHAERQAILQQYEKKLLSFKDREIESLRNRIEDLEGRLE